MTRDITKDIFTHHSFLLVINIVILILGCYAYSNLKIQLTPTLPLSSLYISIANPGVQQEIIEKHLTQPFENIFSTINGLESMISTSQVGESKITLNISPKVPITEAINQVRDLVLKNKALLPEGAQEPKVSTESFAGNPMMYITVSNKDTSMVAATDLEAIRKMLNYVEGVAGVNTFGLSEKAIHIAVDPEKSTKYHIPITSILAELMLQNSQLSGGKMLDAYKTQYITFGSKVQRIEDFQEIDLESNNVPVKLKNVAHISLSDKEARNFAYWGDKKVVVLGIVAKADANPIDVSNNVKKFIKVQSKSASKMHFEVILDDSNDVLKSFNEVQRTLVEAIILVSLIILLLIGSLRYSFIAICSIPVSMAACFIALMLFGYTLNTITMLGIILAIGLVVDDAIVVIEQAEVNYKKTDLIMHSIQRAVKNLFLPVLVLTMTLAAIYTPIIFIKGEVGKIFQEFSLAVISSLLMSFVIAFTLTPVMFLQLIKSNKPTKFAQAIEHVAESITIKYIASLFSVLRTYKVFVAAVVMFSIVGIYAGISLLKVEIEPFEKRDLIVLTNTFQANTSLEYIHKYMTKIVKRIENNTNISNILRIEESPKSTLWIALKSNKYAALTVQEIEQQLSTIAVGGEVAVRIAQSKNAGNGKGTTDLGFYVNDPDSTANALAAVKDIKEKTQHIFSSLYMLQASPVEDISVSCNQNKLFKYGLHQKNISDVLDILFSGRKIGVFKDNDTVYDVVVKSESNVNQKLENIKNMRFITQKGRESEIQFKDVCDVEIKQTPNQILRYNQQFAVEVVATTKPEVSLKEVVATMQDINAALSGKTNITYTKQTQVLIDSIASFTMLILIGTLGIYLLMYAYYNDLWIPWLIISTIPITIGSSLLALYVFNGSMNIYTEVSMITLAGIITKHGVLLCSSIKDKLSTGKSIIRAAVEGSAERLRPILITSLAMSIGLVALFFNEGNYANSRFQIATTLVVGIVFGSLLTLYITPVLYVILHKARHGIAQYLKRGSV